ncbi:porin [Jannaschia sp. LMIT008]|uniref:porin n=1 Tax=Jannaschia maritima TaxID=3032585 RepID=UPI00281248FC|nr:porin [Jannaschia sp. LMIT008]
MKKILFASTALVMTAGFAAAQNANVAISGSASMGIVNSDRDGTTTDAATGVTNRVAGDGAGVSGGTGGDTEFLQDVDVRFTMTGETDGGLAFGATVDLDEAPNLGNERDDMGVTVFISGAFGTLTMGDTDGALDFALTEVGFSNGSINEDETSHAGWNGNSALDGTFGGQVLRYDYTLDAFSFAISAEIDDDDDDSDDSDPVLGIGARYEGSFGGGTVGFGIGYQASEVGDNDRDALGVSLNGSFGDFQAGISYLEVDFDGDDSSSYDHIGVGIGYNVGAISLSANYGDYDYDDGDDSSGYGLTAGYDLGGGAVVRLGYGNSDVRGDGDDEESYSFGVSMAF